MNHSSNSELRRGPCGGAGWPQPAAPGTQLAACPVGRRSHGLAVAWCTALIVFGFVGVACAAELPEPRAVAPGEGGSPPSDAVVLFDGQELGRWRDAQGGPARWKVADGFAEVNGTGNVFSRDEFGDCQLHLEWAAPAPPKGDGQGRGNSGVYFQGRYEIQILDSYQSRTYPDGQAGAFYGNAAPLVNASRKPGEWQTYDIIFRAPKLADGGQEVAPGSLTVFHNGVLIQDHVPVRSPTTAAAFGAVARSGKGPLMLQDHGNPVRYRNIWLRPL